MGDVAEQGTGFCESLGIKMEELDGDVVYVDDWVGLGQEQVIVSEQLTDLDANGTETYFIEVAEDSVSNLSVLNIQKTDSKTLKKKRLKAKDRCVDTENADVDLSWLIGFKLDGLMNNNVLDDWPNKDAKKSDSNQSQMKPKSPDGGATFNELRKKPPFTYTELIECALQEKGPLTVSEIYQWISETFPYYKAHDDRWKNSVRHNLSINPYFRKGVKAKQGSGHLWTVSSSADCPRALQLKRQRYQNFKAYTKKLKTEWSKEDEAKDAEMEDAREAEIAAAIIEDKENREINPHLHIDVLLPTHGETHGDLQTDVRKKVAVEFIQIPKLEENNDFLYPPVSKEDLIGECGFFSQIELNLTAETEQMDSTESEQTFENLEEELGFQFTDVSNQCPQLCL